MSEAALAVVTSDLGGARHPHTTWAAHGMGFEPANDLAVFVRAVERPPPRRRETPTIPPQPAAYRRRMHLADRHDLPPGYHPRRYRGRVDHPAMTRVLAAYREHIGDEELPTVEEFDAGYAHLVDCDPELDIAVIEADHEVVAYGRTSRSGGDDSPLDLVVFTPILPEHLDHERFDRMLAAQEAHMLPWADSFDGESRYQAFAGHPGPGQEPTGEAAWLEASGYEAVEWAASLVRADLDDIPDLPLPHGVDVRPVTHDQMRPIWEAHLEAFRGEWDFREPTPEMVDAELAEPYVDRTLWKVAWAGDQIVGQVKSFVNPEENAARGYLRGYTEHISTHHDWRNQGIAGALLAMSLRELRNRGMTEAALGVDTNNQGGAFQLYTRLGFEMQAYQAIYGKAVR